MQGVCEMSVNVGICSLGTSNHHSGGCPRSGQGYQAGRGPVQVSGETCECGVSLRWVS